MFKDFAHFVAGINKKRKGIGINKEKLEEQINSTMPDEPLMGFTVLKVEDQKSKVLVFCWVYKMDPTKN